MENMTDLYSLISQVFRFGCLGLFTTLCFFTIKWFWMFYDKKKNLLHIPGPTPLPVVGNAALFTGPSETYIPVLEGLRSTFGPVFRIHIGSCPIVYITRQEDFEKILSSTQHVTKGVDYRYFQQWLGEGLITSNGSKWSSQRKLLTPAFHFGIIGNFTDTINEQADILCDKLEEKVEDGSFNICPMIIHCMLDTICETAMGCSVNAQQDCDSEYVKAVHNAADLLFRRTISPWLQNDWLFSLSPTGRETVRNLKVLHNFTEDVIRERKEALDKSNEEDESLKKVPFLDLLIKASKNGTVLSDLEIREEVDTFMFAGHESTAQTICFTLYLLARNFRCQRQCQEELDAIFQGSSRPATAADVAQMKFLDSCIKESQRLLGVTPLIARTTVSEVELGGYSVPPGTQIYLFIRSLHRDPETFPNPELFDPNRFMPGNKSRRHPYAFVPFSAGPRNCIGQKFAMIVQKIVISTIFRRFNLECSSTSPELVVVLEALLKPKHGIFLNLSHRD